MFVSCHPEAAQRLKDPYAAPYRNGCGEAFRIESTQAAFIGSDIRGNLRFAAERLNDKGSTYRTRPRALQARLLFARASTRADTRRTRAVERPRAPRSRIAHA